jgi:uncharacterized protein (TIGR03437 family)
VKLCLAVRRLALLALLCGSAAAAPILRLPPVTSLLWVPGSAATQIVCASNAGDGTLSLSASVQSGAGWLTVSVGANQCIQLTADPSSLSQGVYTAEVTISDPNAIDAPQVLWASVVVDGGPPVDLFVAPGMAAESPIAGGCVSATASAQDGAGWLSTDDVTSGTLGVPVFQCIMTVIRLAPPAGMAPGTYSGSVTVSGSTPYTIPVTMHVTTEPIAVPSVSPINLKSAQGGPAVAYPFLPPVSFTNSGMGALQVLGVSASGVGVSAYLSGQQAMVTVDPVSRAPGIYTDGMVTIQCNGGNCPLQIPVSLEIDPPAPPAIDYRGVVDNYTFVAGYSVAPGDICILRGQQLSMAAPTWAAGLPLPASLGGAAVLVDGVSAPLFYSSSGQIAFQAPYGTAVGTALVQVVRDGQAGNTVTVSVAAGAPWILGATDTAGNLRDVTHPTHAGETLILTLIGLGATNPVVPAGTAAPVDPPAMAVDMPSVLIDSSASDVRVTPSFAGLSGGSVGLYQVIFTVPADTPAGGIEVTLVSGGAATFFSDPSIVLTVQ